MMLRMNEDESLLHEKKPPSPATGVLFTNPRGLIDKYLVDDAQLLSFFSPSTQTTTRSIYRKQVKTGREAEHTKGKETGSAEKRLIVFRDRLLRI